MKKPDKDNHPFTVAVRMTDKQYERLKTKARVMGCNLSQCVRQILFKRVTISGRSSAEELMTALNQTHKQLDDLIDICRKTTDAQTLERAIRSAERMFEECKTLLQPPGDKPRRS